MAGVFQFSVVVPHESRGLLWRDGKLIKVLGPGRFSAFDPGKRLSVQVHKVVRSAFSFESYLAIKASNSALAAEHFERVSTEPDVFALVTLDGSPAHIIGPNAQCVYWKSVSHIEVEHFSTRNSLALSDAVVARLPLGLPMISAVQGLPRAAYHRYDVAEFQQGLLFIDGAFAKVLAPGSYHYWNGHRKVDVHCVDMRETALEVTAQEILTKDRIGIRVTLTAFLRCTDAKAYWLSSADPAQAIYKLIQFAIREAVASRTLDEILAARGQLDADVRAYVTEKARSFAVEIGSIGVKDIILPGDIRELINKVVEAERVAKANLIRRQEETAAMRSLLNTASLMRDNPMAVKLKELEALEKLVSQVGTITLHSGEGQVFDGLLNRLFQLKDSPKAD